MILKGPTDSLGGGAMLVVFNCICGSSTSGWEQSAVLSGATWCRVQQGAASADCRVSHQPRLIFTGSLARVASRAANESLQKLKFRNHPSSSAF